MLENLLEQFPEEKFLKADGFDDAVIRYDEDNRRLIYSVHKCLEILMDDMTEEQAIEYFYFNTASAYVGEKTPIWCYDIYN